MCIAKTFDSDGIWGVIIGTVLMILFEIIIINWFFYFHFVVRVILLINVVRRIFSVLCIVVEEVTKFLEKGNTFDNVGEEKTSVASAHFLRKSGGFEVLMFNWANLFTIFFYKEVIIR